MVESMVDKLVEMKEIVSVEKLEQSSVENLAVHLDFSSEDQTVVWSVGLKVEKLVVMRVCFVVDMMVAMLVQ
jgi:hypothetical protein